ncbi:MAG: hypothetical protein AB3N17_09390 [Tateyamaria sp.]
MPLTETQRQFIETYITPVTSGDGTSGASLVELQKMRLAWDGARKQASRDLQKLEKSIVATFANEPELVQVANIARGMSASLDRLDASLIDCLDNALNAEDANARESHSAKAAKITRQYISILDSDPVLKIVEDNPFVPVKITTPMREALLGLSGTLG